MKINHLFLIGISMLFCLIILELAPSRNISQQLEFDKGNNLQLSKIDCIEIDDLLDRQWEVTTPYSVSRLKSNSILVLLENSIQPELKKSDISRHCSIALEVRVDIPGISLNPGENIITSYQTGSPQSFKWKIISAEKDTSGTIWIYLLVNDSSKQLTRIPLFAVPVEIKRFSLMGMSF